MERSILYTSFNSLVTRISVGTHKGFMIYSVDPFKLIDKLEQGGCSIVEVLDNRRVVATVGTGEHPSSSRRILKIYDMDLPEKEVCRIPFETPILSVRITTERLVIVLETEIHLYNMQNLSLLAKLSTQINPKGIVTISNNDDLHLLAYPSPLESGVIILYNLFTLQPYRTITDLQIHQLQIIQFSQDGKYLATASECGTIVKIVPVQENLPDRYKFRRSTLKSAEITSLTFDVSSNLFALSSSKGTVHIFDRLSGLEHVNQPKTTFSLFYGDEARSFTTIKQEGKASVVAFSEDSKIVYTITTDGKFSLWQLNSRSQYWINSRPNCKLIQEYALIGHNGM